MPLAPALGGPLVAPPAAFAVAALGALDLPGLGSLVPSFLSSFEMIWGFGMAFPLSYWPMTWGFSLMAVARSFWVIFLAVRACMIALERDLSTLAILPASSASSSLRVDMMVAEWAEVLPPAPYLGRRGGEGRGGREREDGSKEGVSARRDGVEQKDQALGSPRGPLLLRGPETSTRAWPSAALPRQRRGTVRNRF